MKKVSRLVLILFTILFLAYPSNVDSNNFKENIVSNKVYSTANSKNLKNLAIFIKFKDSDLSVTHHLDDDISVENAKKIYNSDELFDMDTVKGVIKVPSFKKYYEMQSYGKLSITTEFFPKVDGKVVSYTDVHPIGYYLKYNDQNIIGYKDRTEALQRETELVNNAVSYVSNQISLSGITSSDIDTDNNGIIDAITFIVEGQNNLPSSIAHSDLLWSHMLNNQGVTSQILGKRVVYYNLLYASDYTEAAGLFSLNRGTYGTIIHEFGHTLGYMDLYVKTASTSNPVGFYDIMGSSIGSNPQNFLTYYISEYNSDTNWHTPLPVINKSTNDITLYKPNFIDDSENRAIKLQIGNNSEYFVVEYHEKQNTYDTYSADESGIIVYRVNENNKYQGNSDGNQGQNNHVYIFRPNETSLGAGKGDLTKATLNKKRPTFGKALGVSNGFDNQTIHYSNGKNSGIIIEVTNQTSDSVTFNVKFPETNGSGTLSDPYLINTTNDFLYLMSLDTKGKYYKITSDLDFSGIGYPVIDFYGNLDGNNKTLKNITTNGSGIFNNVGVYGTHTIIQNLNIENIKVISSSGNHLGGFASSLDNVTLKNIDLKSGTVTSNSNSVNMLQSTGGFAGSASNDTIIENCYSSLDVTANKNVGGFIGINLNATIKSSYSTGKVTGNSNVGAFIGLQCISDNIYKVPENVYYDSKGNRELNAVGGYAHNLHNLNALDEASLGKGITGIYVPLQLEVFENESVEFEIITNPTTTLPFSVSVENSNIEYVNGKISGKSLGNSNIYVTLVVGNKTMKLTSSVTVSKNQGISVTEEQVLKYLGLTKKGSYVTGFTLGEDISIIIQKFSNYQHATFKGFKNTNNQDINSGIISTGMKFTLNINNTDYTYIVVIKGDVNGDGAIYATDYVSIKNHIMGKTILKEASLIAADVDNDGNVYATDYVKIKNYIMGKDTILQ